MPTCRVEFLTCPSDDRERLVAVVAANATAKHVAVDAADRSRIGQERQRNCGIPLWRSFAFTI